MASLVALRCSAPRLFGLHHAFKKFDRLAVLGQGYDSLFPALGVTAAVSALAAELAADGNGVDLGDLDFVAEDCLACLRDFDFVRIDNATGKN